MHERSLIPHQSDIGIVATYQQVQKEITTSFGLLDQAKKRLNQTGITNQVLKTDVKDFDLPGECQNILSYSGRWNLTSLDNCFHLLDGKGVAKYPDDTITIMNSAIGNKKWDCETEYFAFRWYQKGSMHIRIKRLDLVRRLNKMVGGNSLKNK